MGPEPSVADPNIKAIAPLVGLAAGSVAVIGLLGQLVRGGKSISRQISIIAGAGAGFSVTLFQIIPNHEAILTKVQEMAPAIVEKLAFLAPA